jgi:hypothetical protein
MPKRVLGGGINKIALVKRLLKEQQAGGRTDKRLVYKSQIPKHNKHYPNFTFKPSDIINVETRFKSRIEIPDLSTRIKLVKSVHKVPNDFEDVKEPIHDAIDFKQMTGNEIILNLSNSEFLRKAELINGLYELSLRMGLKANTEVRDYDIIGHPYIGKALQEAKKRMFNLKVMI